MPIIEIDATGLACPLPVLRLQRALRAAASGARVRLMASDPMAAVDVPHFCRAQTHILHAVEVKTAAAPDGQDLLIFDIEKAG